MKDWYIGDSNVLLFYQILFERRNSFVWINPKTMVKLVSMLVNFVQEINHQLKPGTSNFPTCQQDWECKVW